MHVCSSCRQERPRREQSSDACRGGREQPERNPKLRVNTEPRLDPDRAADHVLHDEARRHHEASHEATAGSVVATQEKVHRDQRRHGNKSLASTAGTTCIPLGT